MKHLFIALFIALAASAAAQDFSIDAHSIDRCLGRHELNPMFCVGLQADVCTERNAGGPDMVITACRSAETEFWDGVLNRTYARVLEHAKAHEAGDMGYEPGQLTTAVREMQLAWINYREATCLHTAERAMPFGSGAGPAISSCVLRETVRQVFQLQYIERSYRQ